MEQLNIITSEAETNYHRYYTHKNIDDNFKILLDQIQKLETNNKLLEEKIKKIDEENKILKTDIEKLKVYVKTEKTEQPFKFSIKYK